MVLKDYAAVVGIDWADQEHAICLIDPHNELREHDELDQEAGAIERWVASLQKRFPNQKVAVCLEQKRGALIYALMKFDCLTLVPVNPKQLARFREALEPSGAKDDPTDAWVLAELLIKHGDRLKVWHPEDEDTRKIRLLAEDRRNLVDERTALTNRLRSRLKQYFPVALRVTGSRLFSELTCQFLLRYPTLEELQEASDKALSEFYRNQRCYRQDVVDARIEEIRLARPLTTDRAVIESSVLIVQSIVQQIGVLNRAIERFDAKLASLVQANQDAEIFESLPGAGAAMVPRLMAAMGTDRNRFDSAREIQNMSGIAPVTKQSGKSKVVHRRWACNRFLLQTFHEFAAHSIKRSVWAKAYYDLVRARGHKHQAAVRALAFKWIRVIFRCWKTRTRYDEMKYTASLIKTNSPVLKYFVSDA